MAAITRAAELLRRTGIPFTLHDYEPDPRPGRRRAGRHDWGAEAAAALDVDPQRVFKTLVARVDGEEIFALVPVSMELDLGLLAAARGGRRASLAEAAVAERLTGYQVGGISPIGSRRALPVIVHEDALLHDTILLSAGRRGLQVELTPDDLVRVTGGQLARIARPR